MLDEALLDKSEFLDKFLLEKLESLRPSDDGLLRFLIPLVSKLEKVVIFTENSFSRLKKSNLQLSRSTAMLREEQRILPTLDVSQN